MIRQFIKILVKLAARLRFNLGEARAPGRAAAANAAEPQASGAQDVHGRNSHRRARSGLVWGPGQSSRARHADADLPGRG